MISDAYRFVFPILGAAATAAAFRFPVVALGFVSLGGFVCYFFRNPRRTIPDGETLVVSPADGKIIAIEKLTGAADGAPDGTMIGIFLSIFDVHVNRAPIAGELERLEYRRGQFRAAFDPEAPRVNEQNVLTIRGSASRVVVRQIAGLIARRVVCWKRPGQRVERGELIGLIRFGSRVDVLLPKEVVLRVKLGDRVKGGSSILGECP